MTTIEKTLLDNALDALDRVFDRESSVIDLFAILFATAVALRETPHYNALESPLAELQAIIRSQTSKEKKRDSALIATEALRNYLADLLPIE